jgi:hypothetical protein
MVRTNPLTSTRVLQALEIQLTTKFDQAPLQNGVRALPSCSVRAVRGPPTAGAVARPRRAEGAPVFDPIF